VAVRGVGGGDFPVAALKSVARAADGPDVEASASVARASRTILLTRKAGPMAANFLTYRDPELDAWARNFDTKINLTPSAYGLSVAQCGAFHGLAQDFTARLTTATDPSTRTKSAIQSKDLSRAALKANARALAKIVNAFPGTTNAQRADLGLTIRDTTPSPVPPPATQPVVSIEGTGGGQCALRLADETAPTRKAKPSGVSAAVVFGKIGPATDPAPTTPDDAKFLAVATRTATRIDLPAGSAGKTLWVLAQWMNERGQLGPVSVVTSAVIAA